MPIRTPTLMTITDPKGLDRALGDLGAKLLTKLSWVDNGFGLAHRVKTEHGFEPVVYEVDGINNMPVLPDESLGNFFFFDRYEQDVLNGWGGRRIVEVKTRLGIVFWGDLRQVYSADWQQRTREHVKEEVLTALKSSNSPTGKVEVDQVFYDNVHIYPNYTIEELQYQHLMRPFFGFRVDFDIIYNNQNLC